MKIYLSSTSADVVKGIRISPSSRRVFVISDIHGCYGKFKKLLKWIEFTEQDILIVNGDMVDRGPNVRGLVDHLMGMKNARVLLGNHEEMMLQCIYSKHNSQDLENQWKRKGGKETLESFGLKTIKDLPLKYRNWFRTRYLYAKVGDYVISHAGVNLHHDEPFRNTKTNREFILWNREVKAPKGRTIVVGHTPTSIKDIIRSLKTTKIHIDGGCVYGGRLVALNLNDRTISTV